MLLFSANQLPKVHYQELPWQLFLRRCAVFYQGCWGATVTYEVGTFVATVFFLFSCVDFSSDMLVVVTSQNHGLRLQPPTAACTRRIAPGSLLSLMAPTRFLWKVLHVWPFRRRVEMTQEDCLFDILSQFCTTITFVCLLEYFECVPHPHNLTNLGLGNRRACRILPNGNATMSGSRIRWTNSTFSLTTTFGIWLSCSRYFLLFCIMWNIILLLVFSTRINKLPEVGFFHPWERATVPCFTSITFGSQIWPAVYVDLTTTLRKADEPVGCAEK